jgi:hypothetical protein
VIEEDKKLKIVNENTKIRNKIIEKDQISYVQKGYDKTLNKHEIDIQKFIISSIERIKLASMIYGVSRNKGERVGFSEDTTHQSMKVLEKPIEASCSDCEQKELYPHFVPEASKAKVIHQSGPKTSESKVLNKSKPKTPKSMVLKSSRPKAKKNSRLKAIKPKVLKDSKQYCLRPKTTMTISHIISFEYF